MDNKGRRHQSQEWICVGVDAVDINYSSVLAFSSFSLWCSGWWQDHVNFDLAPSVHSECQLSSIYGCLQAIWAVSVRVADAPEIKSLALDYPSPVTNKHYIGENMDPHLSVSSWLCSSNSLHTHALHTHSGTVCVPVVHVYFCLPDL